MVTANPLINTATNAPIVAPAPVVPPVAPPPVVPPVAPPANQKFYRPMLTEWMEKSGLDFNTAADLYNGVIGSNTDTRDWRAIMSAADPVAAARQATNNMYGGVTTKMIDYGNEILPKLVAADGTILTNPSKRNINYGVGQGLYYDKLTKNSTADDLAAAYGDYLKSPGVGYGGKDTPENRRAAADRFGKRGLTGEIVGEAFRKFANPASAALAPAAAPNFEQMVRDAYGSIGRNEIGDAPSNIDQAGFDYYLNALETGQSTPEAFQRNFQTAVTDYLVRNPADQYSTYVTDYLEDEKTRKADAAVLNRQFGAGDDAIAYFNRNPDVATAYAQDSRGLTPKQFSEEHYASYGSKEGRDSLATSGILSGFKYAKDNGLSEDQLKQTLGSDVFNRYKTGFADYAKTGIANILADDKLSFDEARTAVKFGRDYGYDNQKLADLTGQKKELFDTINKSYDETADKVIGSTLSAENIRTDADRAIESLKLQAKYGFDDKDIARATGYDAAKLKSDLDPVRNFGTDLSKTLNNADLTTSEVKTFLDSAKENGAISQLYNTKLEAIDTYISDAENRWKTFSGVDPMQAQRVYDQLGQQREKLGGQYYRGVFGDPLTMAATLTRKGIGSLADIGQKEKFEAIPAEKRYTTNDGMPVDVVGDGSFVGPDGSTIPKSQVKTTYGRTESTLNPDGESSTSTFIPISEEDVDKDGNYQQLVGKVAINKNTGEEIADLNGQIAGQNSSGGLNKKWNTLNVQFGKNGVPILTASSERTGLGGLVQDLAPMISMALPFVLPGLGTALSGMLPGAAVAASGAAAAIPATLMNQALTQGIIRGGLTTLGGGQFEKGFLSGAINPVVNTGISSLMPSGINPDLAKSLTSAGTGAVQGALQGYDFSDILKGGITSGLTNYGLNTALGASGFTPQQLNFATGIVAPLLQGDKINPMTAFSTLVNADQQRQRTAP